MQNGVQIIYSYYHIPVPSWLSNMLYTHIFLSQMEA